MKDYLLFLRNPKAIAENNSFKAKFIALLKVFLIREIFVVIITVCRFLMNKSGLPYQLKSKWDGHRAGYDLWGYGLLYLFMTIIYLPVYEELAFRLGLKYRPFYIVLSLALISSVLVKIIVGALLPSDFYFVWDISASALFVLIYHCILIKRIKAARLKDFYSRHLNTIVWLSCLIFALIHLNNFVLSGPNEIPALLVTELSFLFSALIFAYLRMKNGIMWAIAAHILNNILITFFSF